MCNPAILSVFPVLAFGGPRLIWIMCPVLHFANLPQVLVLTFWLSERTRAKMSVFIVGGKKKQTLCQQLGLPTVFHAHDSIMYIVLCKKKKVNEQTICVQPFNFIYAFASLYCSSSQQSQRSQTS